MKLGKKSVMMKIAPAQGFFTPRTINSDVSDNLFVDGTWFYQIYIENLPSDIDQNTPVQLRKVNDGGGNFDLVPQSLFRPKGMSAADITSFHARGNVSTQEQNAAGILIAPTVQANDAALGAPGHFNLVIGDRFFEIPVENIDSSTIDYENPTRNDESGNNTSNQSPSDLLGSSSITITDFPLCGLIEPSNSNWQVDYSSTGNQATISRMMLGNHSVRIRTQDGRTDTIDFNLRQNHGQTVSAGSKFTNVTITNFPANSKLFWGGPIVSNVNCVGSTDPTMYKVGLKNGPYALMIYTTVPNSAEVRSAAVPVTLNGTPMTIDSSRFGERPLPVLDVLIPGGTPPNGGNGSPDTSRDETIDGPSISPNPANPERQFGTVRLIGFPVGSEVSLRRGSMDFRRDVMESQQDFRGIGAQLGWTLYNYYDGRQIFTKQFGVYPNRTTIIRYAGPAIAPNPPRRQPPPQRQPPSRNNPLPQGKTQPYPGNQPPRTNTPPVANNPPPRDNTPAPVAKGSLVFQGLPEGSAIKLTKGNTVINVNGNVIDDVEVGEWTVSGTLNGQAEGKFDLKVTVKAGKVAVIDYTKDFKPSLVVRGLPNGTKVTVTGANGKTFDRNVVDGIAEFVGLEAGSWQLTHSASGGSSGQPVSIEQGRTADLTITPAAVRNNQIAQNEVRNDEPAEDSKAIYWVIALAIAGGGYWYWQEQQKKKEGKSEISEEKLSTKENKVTKNNKKASKSNQKSDDSE